MRTSRFALVVRLRVFSLIALAFALGLPLKLAAGTITYLPISSDETSGISSTKTYTHAIDYGNSGAALINGVQFTQGGPGVMPGPSASNTVGTGNVTMSANHGGGGAPIPVVTVPTGGAHDLLNDFVYNTPNATIQLTGLTPGQEYDFRLYHRQWAPPPGSLRSQIFSFDGDGLPGFENIITIDEDNATLSPPNLATADTPYALSFRYVAGANGILNVSISQTGNGTYHLYGLTNELVPEPASVLCWSLFGVGSVAVGLIRYRFKRVS